MKTNTTYKHTQTQTKQTNLKTKTQTREMQIKSIIQATSNPNKNKTQHQKWKNNTYIKLPKMETADGKRGQCTHGQTQKQKQTTGHETNIGT